MPIFVRKKLRHLTNKLVEEAIGAFPGGIKIDAIHSKFMNEGVRSRQARQLWIADKPGVRVRRHIKLRQHANAAISRVGDYVANLSLRVKMAVRSQFLQAREPVTLHAKALVVGQVPMKDIEFDYRHCI
jgi:hypothetical protein